MGPDQKRNVPASARHCGDPSDHVDDRRTSKILDPSYIAMSFKESNEDPGGSGIMPGPFGLPVEWGTVADLKCPHCSDGLESFEHVGRFICPCGFKISAGTVEQIKKFTKYSHYSGPGICRGYGFGLIHFKNETPF